MVFLLLFNCYRGERSRGSRRRSLTHIPSLSMCMQAEDVARNQGDWTCKGIPVPVNLLTISPGYFLVFLHLFYSSARLSAPSSSTNKRRTLLFVTCYSPSLSLPLVSLWSRRRDGDDEWLWTRDGQRVMTLQDSGASPYASAHHSALRRRRPLCM